MKQYDSLSIQSHKDHHLFLSTLSDEVDFTTPVFVGLSERLGPGGAVEHDPPKPKNRFVDQLTISEIHEII